MINMYTISVRNPVIPTCFYPGSTRFTPVHTGYFHLACLIVSYNKEMMYCGLDTYREYYNEVLRHAIQGQ